ncbi:MAG: tetratricopeptide repeat protein [Rhodomicrobium sp.]
MGSCLRRLRVRTSTIIVLSFLVSSKEPTPARAETLTLSELNRQIAVLKSQQKFAQALDPAQQAVKLAEREYGPNHLAVATQLEALGLVYRLQFRLADAEPFYRQALSIREHVVGKDHISLAPLLIDLANVHHQQGQYPQAEAYYRRSLQIREKALGPNHLDIAESVGGLAVLYSAQSRYAEAEQYYKRALTLLEKAYGPYHYRVGSTLLGLSAAYQYEGRYAEAEQPAKQATAVYKKAFGEKYPLYADALKNLAEVYRALGRFKEAEPLYRQSIAVYEGNQRHDLVLDVAQDLEGLSSVYLSEGRLDEAISSAQRAEENYAKIFGANNRLLYQFALIDAAQGHFAEARQKIESILSGFQSAGADHANWIKGFTDLAAIYFAQRDWPKAAASLQKGADVAIRRLRRGSRSVGQRLTVQPQQDFEAANAIHMRLLKAMSRLPTEGGLEAKTRASDTFTLAQWATDFTLATTLAEMAVRNVSGDGSLARSVRERQDLFTEWQSKDKSLAAARSNPPSARNAAAEQQLLDRLSRIDARIAELDAEIGRGFPDYSALAFPAPLSIVQVQAELRDDEALMLFVATPEWKQTPEETFVWVVTKTDMRWVRSDLGKAALTREVQALRCGLDDAAWDGPRCNELTGETYTEADRNASKLPPFDHARAYRLYQALFGQVKDLIKGKSLLIVPSGTLTQLPFQVLVTAAPQMRQSKTAAWLIREHAFTVLPAVSSLKALRRVARPSAATKPMIGFGNPLLDGDPKDLREQKAAQRARDFKTCAEAAPQRVASNEESHRGVAPLVTRGGLASVSQIRYQVPLPETAQELCAVARDVGADPGEMRLGARATEREVKHLSETGQLAQYRIVHFATHGALAGQLTGTSEPGLILTPPDVPSEGDDGYLTASEIAALKLDADWVILSACNTAAGGATGAEALSGLARAFIYAQARALLVSHWAVKSGATVKLVTGAIRRLASDKTIGRAEAMRQSMLALIETGTEREAHPAYWAPFVVVGEGGAGK